MPLEVSHFGGRSSAPWIIATSTLNALAPTSYQTWAFRRAELTGFVGCPFRLPNGNPMAFSRVRQLDPRQVGPERLEALAVEGIEPLAPLLGQLAQRVKLGVVLCLPERMDPSTPEARGHRARRRVERRVVGPFIEEGFDVLTRTITRGHAGFAYAATEVGELIGKGTLDAALIVGVDSLYDPFILQDLIRQRKILDAESREGFVPGEAASAVLLARRSVARDLGRECLALLEGAATNEEVATQDNDVGMLGLGLSRPAVALVKRLKDEGRVLGRWISDATAEPIRVQELQYVWPRAAHLAPSGADMNVELLPTHLGELGAATMPTAVCIAVEGLRRNDPEGATTALVTGSSHDGSRGVLLLSAAPRTERDRTTT